MEQTALQQRIEERAKERLLKDLKEIADKEYSVSNFIGKNLYPQKLAIQIYYGQQYYGSNKEELLIKNDFTQQVFDAELPRYIKQVTDEILQMVDQIGDLVNSNKELQEDLP